MDSSKFQQELELAVTKTRLEGVLLIKPPTIFEDFRGSYVELYNDEVYKNAGISVEFIQDDISTSKKNVLRGFHFQSKYKHLHVYF